MHTNRHTSFVHDDLSLYVTITVHPCNTKNNHLHICGTDAATKFKFSAQMHYGRLFHAAQKICRNAAGVTEYNTLWKICDQSHFWIFYSRLASRLNLGPDWIVRGNSTMSTSHDLSLISLTLSHLVSLSYDPPRTAEQTIIMPPPHRAEALSDAFVWRLSVWHLSRTSGVTREQRSLERLNLAQG